MKTIAFYDIKDYEQSFFEQELSTQYNLFFSQENLTSASKITPKEQNAEIISVFTGSRVDSEVLKNYFNLKLILTRSVGYSHIDTDYCREKNIIIANTPHYGDYTVAEYSFGILLNIIRKISFAMLKLKQGEMYPQTFGTELFGKTIGIAGTGSIGSKSVKIANGFSMNILCFDTNQNQELISKYNASYVDLNTLCKLSDIIMLHAPLTPKTYHIINKDTIALMKENTVIVNTARGELIDTEALYDALIDNKISYAALDVLEFEETISNKRPGENLNLNNLRTSLINSKLLNLENVLATPHVAYDTKEAVDRILNMTIENLNRFSKGESIINQIQP